MDAILLSLRVLGGDAYLQLGDSIGFAITSHISRTESDHLEPTQGEHNTTPNLQLNRPSLHLYSMLERTDRLTMFLPPREPPLTWGSACLGEDTEILLADGTLYYSYTPLDRQSGQINRKRGE